MTYQITEEQRQQLLDALQAVESLIEHQYTGTREGMSYLQNTADDAQDALTMMQSLAPVDAEPVAYIEYSHGTQYLVLANNLAGGRVTSRMRPLYTHPAPLRELSDAEIRDLWVTEIETYEDALAFARAVLRKAGEK